MKILLLHPDDSADTGPWAETRWDWAVDLGWSGRHAYTEQSERLGFRVSSIHELLDHEQHRFRLRELLALGQDRIVDSDSIDWWEAFSVAPQSQLEQIMRLSALAEQIPENEHNAEIAATRPHYGVRVLSLLLRRKIKTFLQGRESGSRIRRYLNAAFALRPAQLAEIAFDKWDGDFQLRRYFVRSRPPSSEPIILLPSSYVNVSRAQLAYARMLPHRRFLFVVTRRNGRLPTLPSNIEIRSLASYSLPSLPATEDEYRRLLTAWNDLQNDQFAGNRILRIARDSGVLAGFPRFLKRGLRIRDAWREVFATEPVTAVLSADEYNPYTRLPTLLARSRKLRAVFCDHGALNVSYAIRRPVSDVYLAKGEMARDYWVNRCGLAADKVVIGGAAQTHNPPSAAVLAAKDDQTKRDWIVFYSEAYELWSARSQTFYTELLPELCDLARKTSRKVVVKLHPFESRRVRKAMIETVLSRDQQSVVEIREGPITSDLFQRAWCSFTVESSVAVESTANGVPCFLCRWFDASWTGYGEQFAKFSAGYPLDSPKAIRDIPRLLEQFRITDTTAQNLQTAISPELLDSVLSGKSLGRE